MRTLFITGTDTGVGKTLLTGMLLFHLRASGNRVLAMKPFCSGPLHDTRFLRRLLGGDLTEQEITPFHFSEPVAPMVAAQMHGKVIRLRDVLNAILPVADRCNCLLLEGSGGLLVPLGRNLVVLDLITALRSEVVVVARNKLGTINHTLLTVRALEAAGVEAIKVVLMDQARPDVSSISNFATLKRLLEVPVLHLPYFGPNAMNMAAVQKNCKKIKKELAGLVGKI